MGRYGYVVNVPPRPGMVYRIHPESDGPRFRVRRVIHEHPEYWVMEVDSLFTPGLVVEVVVLRGPAAGVRQAG